MQLYPHQQQVLDDLQAGYEAGHRCQVCALATGGGKTVIAAHKIKETAERGVVSMFVVDRVELVGQAARTLMDLGLRVGTYQGSNTYLHMDDEVIVASIQTIRARKMPPPAGFVIIDECHVLHKSHIKLMQRWDAVQFIGLSATPLRPDLGRYFSNLVRGPSIKWLTDNGFLTPARAYCPGEDAISAAMRDVRIKAGEYVEADLGKALNSKTLIGDIIAHWKNRAADRPTLVFAVDIAHSKSIVEDFADEGIDAAHLDAYTPPEQRQQMIDAFRAGKIQVLSSVNVLGIGFDYPGASCAVLARPTLSEALHIQQLGRVIRRAEGKSDALILDHAGNTSLFGLPIHFEVPELGTGNKPEREKKKKAKKLHTCKHCAAVLPPGTPTCPECGIDRPVSASNVVYTTDSLQKYEDRSKASEKEPMSLWERQLWYQALLWQCRARGHKLGWAYHAFLDRFDGQKPPWAWRELDPIEPTWEQARWIRGYYKRQSATRRRERLA